MGFKKDALNMSATVSKQIFILFSMNKFRGFKPIFFLFTFYFCLVRRLNNTHEPFLQIAALNFEDNPRQSQKPTSVAAMFRQHVLSY